MSPLGEIRTGDVEKALGDYFVFFFVLYRFTYHNLNLFENKLRMKRHVHATGQKSSCSNNI